MPTQSPHRPPPYQRPRTAPAPHLTVGNLCSECHVRPVWAAGQDMKVCPNCYALLWHIDWDAEAKAQRAKAAEEARMRAAMANMGKKSC